MIIANYTIKRRENNLKEPSKVSANVWKEWIWSPIGLSGNKQWGKRLAAFFDTKKIVGRSGLVTRLDY